MPRCKHCKELFKPKYFNQKYHLDRDECLKAMIQENRDKESKRIIQNQRKEKSDWAKEKKERKEANLTHSQWLQILQKTFNTFIRIRDAGNPCISCQTTSKDVVYAAGHFWTVKGFPSVRFDEDNLHLQCNAHCNMYLAGNINEYRPRLIEKIGLERFEALEYRARNTTLKLSIHEIKEMIIKYKSLTKHLKDGGNLERY
jgi:hypothetical protein